ncbi:MAG: anti-sigma factor [Vulcanimicrobiota bacterium]
MQACQDVQDQLTEYLNGHLSDPVTVEEHLASCEDCRLKKQFLVGLRGALVRSQPEFEYPAEVQARLLEAIAQERQRKVRPLRPLVFKVLAAAAVICLVCLGYLYRPRADEAIIALVDHHETCFDIAPSPGRKSQYQRWLDKLGGDKPPSPTVSSELVAYDQRECPAGEVRAGHLMYLKGDQRVSVYVLPASDFLASYQGELEPQQYQGYTTLLTRKDHYVYGVVAHMPRQQLEELVDLQQLAQRGFLLGWRPVDHG